ncbi:hypothetical protein Ciccas_000232 [Cichlidogyrus casuarinus]|uniref:C2H2-type domain-containing protein n=1 Tax=Cichlidogyrus casuarinus TaxID=1844966 RepID=A0ABD2QNF5_9PLAT
MINADETINTQSTAINAFNITQPVIPYAYESAPTNKPTKQKTARQIAPKNYGCHLCPSRYTQEKALREHLNKKHANEPMLTKVTPQVPNIQFPVMNSIPSDMVNYSNNGKPPDFPKSTSRKRTHSSKARTRKNDNFPSKFLTLKSPQLLS